MPEPVLRGFLVHENPGCAPKDRDGKPVPVPRLKSLVDGQKRSLTIHIGGDNHSNHPAPPVGGRARIAYGVIGG